MSEKIRVAVIFGGRSGEHEVSLMSARNILQSLDPDRFEVIPVGITREGQWLLTGDPMKSLQVGITQAGGTPVALLTDPSRRERGLIQVGEAAGGPTGDGIDVVFPVLHGPMGEDGTIQGLLELANLPYVGSGVLGSALGMDKVAMKTAFIQAGIPTARHRLVLRREWDRVRSGRTAGEPLETLLQSLEAEFGYPCFVKPANLGSSVGVSKAHDRAELVEALDLAAHYDRRLLVEEFIDAREVECSVLGNEDPVASVPGEVVPCNEFYDYKAKYIDDASDLVIPAPLGEELTREIQRLAVSAFVALDCAGMARVDFFVQRGTNRPLVNEVNTIPGFTSISMYPKLWEATGLSQRELVTRLIELALERHEDKRRSSHRYDRG